MVKQMIQDLIGNVKCAMGHIQHGKHCYVGLDVKIVNSGGVILGDNVKVRPSSCLYTNSKSKIVMGNNVEVGNHSTISAKNCVTLADGVLTGPHVFIADHNHEYKNPSIHIYRQGVKANANDSVFIGEGTWLGTNVVVVGNVHIGKQSVIGANSVVTRDIPDYSVAAGIPAKVIKRYDFEKKEWVRV